jgi:hypothetical protein
METKDFGLNEPQAKMLLVNANKNYAVWARGTGKTTGVLGPKSIDLVHKMPQAKGGFIGKDYEQILDRTLPEIVAHWVGMGYQENHHWRIGKPLGDWERAIVPPLKWEHCVSWYNGTAIPLLSLAVEGVANGLSLQWVMGDEMKFWNQNRLKEILKAVRGLRKEFGHLPEYLSHWFCTDKWVNDIADIQWILDKKKLMVPEKVEVIYTLQLEVNELCRRLDAPDIEDQELNETAQQIARYNEILTALRQNTVHFSEATSKDNLAILGQEYLDSQREELPEEEYDVAIDNKNPKKSRHSFYPALNEEVHYYSADNDVMITRPLVMAADYQASISPMCVAQYATLPGAALPTLNFIRGLFALHPKGLHEACMMFLDTFKHHGDKTLYYVYDHTAVGRNPLGKTFSELIVETIGAPGTNWTVIPVYIGKAPEHNIKYTRIKTFHANADPATHPLIRYNQKHNEECIISMERARAIQEAGGTKKEKKHEDTVKYPDYPQQYAPHFSDAHDQLLWATHELAMVPIFNQAAPFTSSIRR